MTLRIEGENITMNAYETAFAKGFITQAQYDIAVAAEKKLAEDGDFDAFFKALVDGDLAVESDDFDENLDEINAELALAADIDRGINS